MTNSQNKFEQINCNLCGANNHQTLYQAPVYGSEVIGNITLEIVICKQCGFAYQNPQLTEDILELHYKSHSSGGVFHLLTEGSRHKVLLKERQKFIESVIPTFEQGVVIDIGGGQGDLISSLTYPPEVDRYLVEPSDATSKMVNDNVKVINSTLENLSSNEIPSCDLLICVSVLEHLKDPNAALRSFSNLLHEGAYLVIEVPNSQTPYLQIAEFYSYEHLNHFTEYTLNKFLINNDYMIIATDTNPSIPNIRIIAKKNSKEQNYTDSCITFERYIKNKEIFLQQTFQRITTEIINRNLESFSIYGAGDHTRAILAKFNFLDKIEKIIDSDSKKSGQLFYGRPIISPSEIKSLKHKTILISSHDFEREIYTTIREYDAKIHIITIYDEII